MGFLRGVDRVWLCLQRHRSGFRRRAPCNWMQLHLSSSGASFASLVFHSSARDRKAEAHADSVFPVAGLSGRARMRASHPAVRRHPSPRRRPPRWSRVDSSQARPSPPVMGPLNCPQRTPPDMRAVIAHRSGALGVSPVRTGATANRAVEARGEWSESVEQGCETSDAGARCSAIRFPQCAR